MLRYCDICNFEEHTGIKKGLKSPGTILVVKECLIHWNVNNGSK